MSPLAVAMPRPGCASPAQLRALHVLSSNLSRRASARIRLWESERVDAVFWIEGTPPVPLAIVLCPRGGSILKDELREIARSGVQTLVSLLEPDEADWLGLAEEGALAGQLGMHFLSYPIQDVHVPANVALVQEICVGSGRSPSRRRAHRHALPGKHWPGAAHRGMHIDPPRLECTRRFGSYPGSAGLRGSRYHGTVAMDSEVQSAAMSDRSPAPIPDPIVDLSFPHRGTPKFLPRGR